MTLNRRGFAKSLAGVVGALAADTDSSATAAPRQAAASPVPARAQSRLSFPFLESGGGNHQLIVAGLDGWKDEGACTVGCCIKPDSGLRVLQSDGSARDDGAGSVRDRSLDLPGSGLGAGWHTGEKNDGGEKQNLLQHGC